VENWRGWLYLSMID
jgi:hypothetical protein